MADSTFHVEVVSPEEQLFSGSATFVLAQTTVGEIGILAHHEPVLGQLVQGGAIAIEDVDGERRAAAIRGGILSVTGESVTVLADSAEWVGSASVEDLRRELEATEDGSEEQAVAQGRIRALEYKNGK